MINFNLIRTAKKIVRNFLDSKYFLFVFVRIANRVNLNTKRRIVGYQDLSSHQQFLADGGNSLFINKIQKESLEKVLILGGYLGESTQKWIEAGAREVLVFEPVDSYFDFLKLRFKNETNIKIQKAIVSNSNGSGKISISGDASSTEVDFKNKGQIAPMLDVIDVIKEFHPSLIEMNIEAGEYAILERLLEKHSIGEIGTLLIQFHNFDKTHELRRAVIRDALRKTHNCQLNYEWVWECWEKVSS